MFDPEEYKRLSVPFHTLSKSKPKKAVSEAPDVEPKAPVHPNLMSSIDMFKHYLTQSSEIRKAHGIERKDGVWSVVNLELVKSLPEWKKEILRDLVKRKG